MSIKIKSKQVRRLLAAAVVIAFFGGNVHAQSTQFENVFTHLKNKMVDGRPLFDSFSGDFWDCMSVNLYGNKQSRSQVENVFQGNDDETEPFFNAAKRCGFFYLAAPYQHSLTNETVDLGLAISYSTPGITAQNSPFGRPPGIEQIADPSALRLPDGRVILFFSGDHRQAFQSARWVTKDPITSHSQSLQFELEQNYNLSERLLWRHISRESNGSWTAFGDLDGFKKWTSSDGLAWQESGESITFSPTPTDVRSGLGLSANRFQFEAFISMEQVADNKWVGVIPHYREALDAETPDPNGNGFDDPAYVLIYSSSDRLNWTYESHIIGPAEGFVEKIGPDLYAFSLYDTVFLSTDLKQWGFGLAPHFTTRGVVLDDGYTLTFGTRSREGIPTFAHSVQVDASTMPSFYTAPLAYENLPTLNQINGTNVGVERAFADTLPKEVNLISVYPNPLHSTGKVTVEVASAGQVQIDVVDLLGRRIMRISDRFQPEGTLNVDFDAQGLRSGLYVLMVSSASGVSTKQIHIIR